MVLSVISKTCDGDVCMQIEIATENSQIGGFKADASRLQSAQSFTHGGGGGGGGCWSLPDTNDGDGDVDLVCRNPRVF